MISKRPLIAKKLASRITILSALLFLAFSAQMANATKIISVSGSLNFGDVALGTAAKRTMTIVNSGTSTLQITNILYPPDFSGSPSTGAVRAGKKLNVTVTFAPTKATNYSGVITVQSDATSGTNTIAISGRGTGTLPTRIISLGGNLNFGSVTVGTNAQRTLFITNSGNSTLTVSNITYPTGFKGSFSGTIAAGTNKGVTVTFSPVSVTNYGGTVTVKSDATSGINTNAISGSGLSSATRIISLGGNLNFSNVLVGATPQRTLFITNSGNSTLTVSNLTYPAGFTGSFSGTVAAGAKKSVTVTFSPVSATNYGGAVTVSSDATSGINTNAISGTGVPIPTRIISLDGDLNFGGVTVGSSTQRLVFITNSGNATLTISNLTLPTGFSGSFTGTISPGGFQTASVTFAPGAVTNYSGAITAISDATSGSNTIAASGTGTPVINRGILLGGDLNFGNVTVGDSAQKTLFITNSGNATLTVSNIAFPDGFSGSFAGPIATGAVQQVTVTFSPVDATNYSGSVTAISDATSGFNSIAIFGTGTPVPSRIISLGGHLQFGSVTVGTSSQRTMLITNSGNSTLTVSNLTFPPGFTGGFSGPIGPGSIQPIAVTFSPVLATNYGDVVTVDSDATSGDNTAAISGAGIATNVPTRIIALSDDLDFGNVEIGSFGQLALTISNVGDTTLTISNITLPEGFSGNWTAGSIEPGAISNLTVTFTPTAAVTYAGEIAVECDATSGENIANASGNGSPLPYVPRKARFSGLFYPGSGVTVDNSGFFSAATALTGTLKAKILLAGNKYSFSAVLSPDGQASGSILRKGLSPLAISIEIHGNVLSGTLSDGTWSADMVANRNVFSKKLNPAPQAGAYSFTIVGSSDATQAPATNGTGLVTVLTSGIAKVTATLGDGTKISQSTSISADGQLPFYASPYSGKGSIFGWLNFTNDPGHEINGMVDWFKLPVVDPMNYPNGFSFQTTVTGSKN